MPRQALLHARAIAVETGLAVWGGGIRTSAYRIGICQDSQPGGGTGTCASRIKGAPDRCLDPVEAG